MYELLPKMDGEVINREEKSLEQVCGYANLNLCRGRLIVPALKEDWTFFIFTADQIELV